MMSAKALGRSTLGRSEVLPEAKVDRAKVVRLSAWYEMELER